MRFRKMACLLLLINLPALCAGTDVAPVRPSRSVTVSPEKLDFGPHTVPSTSQPMAATLTNVGTANVAIRDISVSGIDFNETNDCPTSLAPNSNCKIIVTFTPAITGQRLGAVIVSVSDPGGPLFLVLSGTGQ